MFEKLIDKITRKPTKNGIIGKKKLALKNVFWSIFLIAWFIGLMLFIYYSFSDSKGEFIIPGAEPDFDKVLNEVQSNEQSFVKMFNGFDRQRNSLKLCYIDGRGKDVYYLRDEEGIEYQVGFGYNWKFHIDTMRVMHTPSIDNLKYSKCEKLDL